MSEEEEPKPEEEIISLILYIYDELLEEQGFPGDQRKRYMNEVYTRYKKELKD